MPKEVRLRQRADRDLDRAVASYVAEGGMELAERFIDAVQAARDHLAAFPLTGSLRFAHQAGIEDLRSWPLRRFPYLIIYLDRETDERTNLCSHGLAIRRGPRGLEPEHQPDQGRPRSVA